MMLSTVGTPFMSTDSTDVQDFKSRTLPSQTSDLSHLAIPVVPASTSPSSPSHVPSPTPTAIHLNRIHQQNNFIEFGGRYVTLGSMEASSLYHCIDKVTLQNHDCKVVTTKSSQATLSGYLRMEGNPGINHIERVFVGPKHTFILFPPSYGDLHSFVRSRKRLPESETIALFRQIVTIVNDCHENGICLRDLKLRKFVFQDPEQTQLKLETLDDAVILDDSDEDQLEDRHGCPAYASPEILENTTTKYSGRASDCWSLGVILYTMVVGRYPFHDTNPSHLLGKIRRGLYHIPNFVSPLTKVIIHSLLRKDPSERMTTEELLDSQLFSQHDMQALPTPASLLQASNISNALTTRLHPLP